MNLTVSIVIPWLAETWEHLDGTLRSLVYFTPDDLVEEYIFVSDGNEDSKEQELKAISQKVRVLALPDREGLIRAKNKGVAVAKAPVIVFLEGHCIVNRDWLQPLLERVALNPHVLAMPKLDIIPQDDWFGLQIGSPGHWRYEWNFNLVYTNPTNALRDKPEPYASPGTSGGIFAMRRDWFQELELFDEGMLQWGGDHMELTMKVWRCGGRIEIVPCSRVGHLFRDVEHRPYNVEVDQVIRNYARLAQVWALDHLEYFYRMKPEARTIEVEGLEELRRSHEKLQCKGLGWYLENVDHEMAWEMDKICIPGAPLNQGGCRGKVALGRSCVDRTMPPSEYARVKAAAEARALASDARPEL